MNVNYISDILKYTGDDSASCPLLSCAWTVINNPATRFEIFFVVCLFFPPLVCCPDVIVRNQILCWLLNSAHRELHNRRANTTIIYWDPFAICISVLSSVSSSPESRLAICLNRMWWAQCAFQLRRVGGAFRPIIISCLSKTQSTSEAFVSDDMPLCDVKGGKRDLVVIGWICRTSVWTGFIWGNNNQNKWHIWVHFVTLSLQFLVLFVCLKSVSKDPSHPCSMQIISASTFSRLCWEDCKSC